MLLNLTQAAEKLGESTTTVRRLVESGALPFVPFGNSTRGRQHLRIDDAAIREFKKRMTTLHKMQPSPVVNDPILIADAAVRLGWKKQKLYDLMKRDRVVTTRMGNLAYISLAELDRVKTMPIRKSPTTTSASTTPRNGASNGTSNGQPHTAVVPAHMLKVVTDRLDRLDAQYQGTLEFLKRLLDTSNDNNEALGTRVGEIANGQLELQAKLENLIKAFT